MSGLDYSTFNTIVDMCNMPSCIFSVEKKEDGSCGQIIMLATNEKFSMTGEDVEGLPYNAKLKRDPKFEEILFGLMIRPFISRAVSISIKVK